MKLLNIQIENFRSIRSPITISFKPITLLFGPNSAGKSSILQAFLCFREVLFNRNADPHFVFGGSNQIDLGGFLALVHGHDNDRKIVIKVSYEIDDDGIADGSELSDRIVSSEWIRIQKALPIRSGFVEVELAFDAAAKMPFVSRYSVGFDDQLFGSISKAYLGDRAALTLNFSNKIFGEIDKALATDGIIVDMYKHLSDRLTAIRGIENGGVEVRDGEGPAGVVPVWGKSLPIWNEVDEIDPVPVEFHEFKQLLSEAFVVTGGMLLKTINSAIYLGPIRSVPARTYIAPDKLDINRWADGMGAWDTLCLRSKERGAGGSLYIKRISEFLVGKQNLDLGYSIEVLEARELRRIDAIIGDLTRLQNDEELSTLPVIEKIKRELQDLPTSLKVQLRDEKRLIAVEADDIGVGVSQVIPVVVGAMDGAHKTFFVEQPELHIHPRVQCALGDLFIEQINSSSEKLFVLETHSEHLILRLLKRVRETSEQNDIQSGKTNLNEVVELFAERRKLLPDQISVVYIESDENGMRVTNISINNEGDFSTPWPKGFFDERSPELM